MELDQIIMDMTIDEMAHIMSEYAQYEIDGSIGDSALRSVAVMVMPEYYCDITTWMQVVHSKITNRLARIYLGVGN